MIYIKGLQRLDLGVAWGGEDDFFFIIRATLFPGLFKGGCMIIRDPCFKFLKKTFQLIKLRDISHYYMALSDKNRKLPN